MKDFQRFFSRPRQFIGNFYTINQTFKICFLHDFIPANQCFRNSVLAKWQEFKPPLSGHQMFGKFLKI